MRGLLAGAHAQTGHTSIGGLRRQQQQQQQQQQLRALTADARRYVGRAGGEAVCERAISYASTSAHSQTGLCALPCRGEKRANSLGSARFNRTRRQAQPPPASLQSLAHVSPLHPAGRCAQVLTRHSARRLLFVRSTRVSCGPTWPKRQRREWSLWFGSPI